MTLRIVDDSAPDAVVVFCPDGFLFDMRTPPARDYESLFPEGRQADGRILVPANRTLKLVEMMRQDGLLVVAGAQP